MSNANITYPYTITANYLSDPVIMTVPGRVACQPKKQDTIPTKIVAGMKVIDAKLSLVELTVVYSSHYTSKFKLNPGDSVFVYATALAGQGWPKEILTIDQSTDFMMVPEEQIFMIKARQQHSLPPQWTLCAASDPLTKVCEPGNK